VAAGLAARGLNLVLVSRSQQKLDAAARDIQEHWPKAQVMGHPFDHDRTAACHYPGVALFKRQSYDYP
jgi:short-subunit dehydrogenase